MKNALSVVAVALTLSASAHADFSDVPDGVYDVDPAHGYIVFSYSHFGLSTPKVGFNSFEAVLDLDAGSPTDSTIDVTIDAKSIDSRVPLFNEHLNSSDWLDTEQFPEITFSSTGIEQTGDGTYAISGELTVRGITKPVTLDATINAATIHPLQKVPVVGVSATGTILRSDFGVGKYAPDVSDEMTVSIEVEMLKRP